MRRREFIIFVSGAAVAWPLAADAQQSTMPVIGFLRSTSLTTSSELVTAFRQGLKEVGYTEGQNVRIEYRWADDQGDRLPALAANLIDLRVAVIVANLTAAFAVKTATTTIPLVFTTGSDPVKDGLVTNLNRPTGNITGVVFFSDNLGSKRLELLRKLVPKATTIGILVNPINPGTRAERRDLQDAARAIGQQLIVENVSSDRELEPAFSTLIQRGAGALLVGSGAFLYSKRGKLVALAARHSLPTSYSGRDFVMAGGLMSYGASIAEAYRQEGVYAGRILKGERPTDLPVMQSTKFEFVVNLKTAKALDLELSPQFLATVDEVIE
jgi:putative ABC transport system substrate-binding protein